MARKQLLLSWCCSLLTVVALAAGASAAAQSNQPTPSFSFDRGDDALELIVADAGAEYDNVWVTLSPKSARDFGAFTQRHINELVDSLVDGQVVSSFTVRAPILGGRMRVAWHIEVERALPMAIELKTGNAKLVVRVNRLAPQ